MENRKEWRNYWGKYSLQLIEKVKEEIYKRGGYCVSSFKTEEEFVDIYDMTTNEFILTSTTGGWNYLNFVLDGYEYYFQLDRNPFFEHYYNKAKFDNENVACYLEKIDKEVFDDDVEKAKDKLLQFLIGAKPCRRVKTRESYKKVKRMKSFYDMEVQ